MNKLLVVAVLVIGACSQQKREEARAHKTADPPPMMQAKSSKPALMIPIPKDSAQLKRLLAMGYTPHEDHLHAPGVTSCPKMSENPVQ